MESRIIINVSPSFLGLVKRSRRGLSIENLCKAADAFQITIDSLSINQVSGVF